MSGAGARAAAVLGWGCSGAAGRGRGLYSCACVASLGEYSNRDTVVPRSCLLVVEKHVTEAVGGWLDQDRVGQEVSCVEFQIGESAMEWRGESGGLVLVEGCWMDGTGRGKPNGHWHGRRIVISCKRCPYIYTYPYPTLPCLADARLWLRSRSRIRAPRHVTRPWTLMGTTV
jgi:hypothetical protein